MAHALGQLDLAVERRLELGEDTEELGRRCARRAAQGRLLQIFDLLADARDGANRGVGVVACSRQWAPWRRARTVWQSSIGMCRRRHRQINLLELVRQRQRDLDHPVARLSARLGQGRLHVVDGLDGRECDRPGRLHISPDQHRAHSLDLRRHLAQNADDLLRGLSDRLVRRMAVTRERGVNRIDVRRRLVECVARSGGQQSDDRLAKSVRLAEQLSQLVERGEPPRLLGTARVRRLDQRSSPLDPLADRARRLPQRPGKCVELGRVVIQIRADRLNAVIEGGMVPVCVTL